MEKFFVARQEDMACEINENGYGCVELLPGTHDGSVVNYKCYLKAGCQVHPQLYGDKIVVYFFGKGTGAVEDQHAANEINELSFYIPYFDNEAYTIRAFSDMEYIMSIVEMSECDKADYDHSHIRLPYFCRMSECVKYDQDCKGPNTTSWHVLNSKLLGHIIIGIVRANGEGTIEKGHPCVHQWNYCVGDSDFELTVDGVTVPHKAGEWSFIPAGPDHSLVAKPGKEVFYVWYEQFTRKDRDFIYTPKTNKVLPAEDAKPYNLARNADLERTEDEAGVEKCELLPGTYKGGITNTKYWIKAGTTFAPELHEDDTVLIMFGKGKGYISSKKHVFNVTEPTVYAPDFSKEPYEIRAIEDMEFVLSVVKMNAADHKMYNEGHIRLPFFCPYSKGIKYDQDCKGKNTTSWSILGSEQLGRIMIGAVRAIGEGTVEKGHPSVEQWNYCLGNSDFSLSVDNRDPVNQKGGDWSYVPAGYDHALVAEEGKEVFYFWYEHFTNEENFRVALAAGDPLPRN